MEAGDAVKVSQVGAGVDFLTTSTVLVQVTPPLLPVKVYESLFGPTKVKVAEPLSATLLPLILKVAAAGVPFQLMVY